jgi:threonine synthase
MSQSYLTHLICLECGWEIEIHNVYAVFPTHCSRCGSAWLDARYDYAHVEQLWPGAVYLRDHSLWRYAELLPINRHDPEISMGEGYTPLTRLLQYERLFNHPYLFVKDERNQPTNSFKDRQAALAVTYMKQQGITECVLASTGNAGVAYAAYCARAGIKLWLFLTSLVTVEKMREIALYGAEVIKVSGTYDETKKVAAEFAARKKLYMDTGAKTVPSKESMKTLGYEIAEQLALKLDPSRPGMWKAPDWYIQSVSGGIGPLGVWKGFTELYQMRLIDRLPKMAIIQAAGCAPMVSAFQNKKTHADPVIPNTLIHVLATGDPGHAYVLLREAIVEHGGTMLAVEDGEAFRAMRHLASRAGISVEPATAVAFAGMEKMLTEGIIKDNEIVVVNCSGHTVSAESHILGDQYDKYILNLELNHQREAVADAPQTDGLGAALQNLDEQVTTIVVIDDNPNDRRLIRRLLQSYKHYRVYEASNGAEGLQVVRDRQPDLIITDLTMPDVDGFMMIDWLKIDPRTAHIPVVVVSAKSLTLNDRKVLEAQSESVWQKGNFETRQLVDHVVARLGHTPVEVIQSTSKRQANQQAVQEDEPTEPVDRSNKQLVLVIDDNLHDVRLPRRLLHNALDIQVIEAHTGREGLKAIYNYHPDLIVLDLSLPDMDGFSIVDTLQRDAQLRDIPIILYSARDLSPEERQTLRANIRSVVTKATLDQQQFADLIRRELN